MSEWEYSQPMYRWQTRDDDPASGVVVAAYVTDEFLEAAAIPELRAAACRLLNQVGSVPPPLERYLPAPMTVPVWPGAVGGAHA